MNARLPTRLVAYRRVGQDSTDPTTDPNAQDPNATDLTGNDPNAGSDSTVTDPNLNGSGSSAVSAITDWLGGLFKGSASGGSSGSNSNNAGPTNNAAVPGVTASSGPSTATIALGVGAAAAAGLAIYAIARRR